MNIVEDVPVMNLDQTANICATVRIGPRAATWKTDPVQVAAELESSDRDASMVRYFTPPTSV